MSMTFATDVNVDAGKQIQINKISAPTASGGTTYSNGTSGQVLKSDGTNIYWASDSNSDTKVQQSAVITTNGAYSVLHAYNTGTSKTTNVCYKSAMTYNPSTKALVTGGTVDGLTLAAATTGFTVSGGTTSKTLTVGESYTLGAACAKAVTDRTSSTAASSSGTNLITERTLYYALENAGSRVAITNNEIDALFT